MCIRDRFKRVRAEVARATSDAQVPWESSSLTGDFYFARPVSLGKPPNADTAPATERSSADTETELLFWQSVKDSQDAADYQAYLRRYPNGRFAEIARNRLHRMQSQK